MVRREAKAHGFVVEKVGPEWRVTNPDTKRSQSVPDRAVGSQLSNARSRIRQLATRTPMQAAVGESSQGRRAGDEWLVQDLVAAAYRSGVTFDVVNGRLRIAADLDNQSWVDVLRRRETEVLAFLLGELARHQQPGGDPVPQPAPLPVTPQGADDRMPKIGDVARVEGPSRKEDLAVDAKVLYDLLREEAAKQGDETEANARVKGVLWRGTLTSVMRSVGADWDLVYQEEVSRYLRDTQHIRCQRRGNPSLWWIRDTWHDGNLTVTRKPTPADVPARRSPAPRSAPEPAPPAVDEYAQLMKLLEAGRTAAATIDRLETENAGLRREVEEKNAMLLSVRAELRADVEALRGENGRLRGELAKLEPFKQFIKAVKETNL
ncbi:hypothetical protein ACIA8R_29850 [Nonomuraea sp. NPDC051191]|uniref:hypothetical protein n=1 Tax=Nonomuraea sp. NPDC051191 TaxID=3364372 RepID=UPI00379248E9